MTHPKSATLYCKRLEAKLTLVALCTSAKDFALVLQLEFGLEAEKEKARRRKRKHLTEAEELRAFAFEDDE